MDVSLIYLMISMPVTEMCMIMKHAKHVTYMLHMVGLISDKIVWKYMASRGVVIYLIMRNYLLDRNDIH